MIVECFCGGVLSYVSQLTNEISEEYDVFIAYGKIKNSTRRPSTPENYRELFNGEIQFFEVRGFSNVKNIFSDFNVIKQLRKIQKEIEPNIIHLHSSVAGAFGRLAFNGKRSNIIYTPHGFYHLMVKQGSIRYWICRTAEKFLGIKRCTILACCKSEEEEAKSFTRDTSFIETGIDIGKLQSLLETTKPTKKEKFTVFTMGRIVEQKQPQLFNDIAKMTPEVEFIWIGQGELGHQLDAPNIKVTGWKSRKEAFELAQKADVFLLCSTGEAIAMSILEMMFLGKLCIVSNAIGNRDVIIDGVNGYVCKDVKAYSEKIKEVKKRYPSNLVKRAHQDIFDKYNTKVMKDKYIEFYSDILQR